MLMKRIKLFCMILFIAVTGFFIISSTAFAVDKSDGAKEGIKVHGHWKIEIFNPDGKRVSITEFENSLVTLGESYIIRLLSGQSVYGNWGVELDASTGTKPCNDDGDPPTPVSCKIGESGGYYLSMNLDSLNLNVVGNWSTSPRQIVLSGSVTAANASQIDIVNTTSSFCNSTTVSIDTCRSTNNTVWQNFTTTTPGTPPSVVAGQLIQVTVTVSFS